MGSGFESQGAHFKENPADSSESAGFLRSLNFIDFGLRYRYPLAPTGDPSSLRFGHPDVATGNIYTSAHLWFRGSRNPAGVAVDLRWFSVCAPCLANWGGGGCRGLACCLVVGVLRAGTRKPATVTRQQRAIISKSLCYRTGQIRVTNSRKSSTSLPCSNKPTPKRVATSALSSNDK